MLSGGLLLPPHCSCLVCSPPAKGRIGATLRSQAAGKPCLRPQLCPALESHLGSSGSVIWLGTHPRPVLPISLGTGVWYLWKGSPGDLNVSPGVQTSDLHDLPSAQLSTLILHVSLPHFLCLSVLPSIFPKVPSHPPVSVSGTFSLVIPFSENTVFPQMLVGILFSCHSVPTLPQGLSEALQCSMAPSPALNSSSFLSFHLPSLHSVFSSAGLHFMGADTVRL